jgi:LysR family transcriptional regulator, hca operon transcriptional activator
VVGAYFVTLGSDASRAWWYEMELRHLRYFVAVADAGNLTVAAQRMLHTSQPSLSRQIRDLENEVGAQLLTRRARGIELTPAGRTFLDHARGVLLQVDAAAEAARRAVHPAKPCFSMGFLTGHELTWMPEAFRILRDELPNIDVMISSQYSPLLAEGLSKGKIDAAFLRKERALPDLAFRLLVKEPLMVILPSDHRLAALKAISPRDLAGETFVIVSHTAPVLRAVIDDYFKRSGITITPAHEADHVTMGISLIMSTLESALASRWSTTTATRFQGSESASTISLPMSLNSWRTGSIKQNCKR